MSFTKVQTPIGEKEIYSELIENLEYVKKYKNQDWDFKILLSGDGMTRTGKSTVAAQCAHYVDPTFAENWKDRVIFDGTKLIDTAYKIGKGKAIIYDEAREGLDSKKQMESYTKTLMDFFSQCGALNHMVFIVLPEFFDLPKGIAITSSIFLINCYAKNGFDRGFFEFYNRRDKKILYTKGKRFLDYQSHKPSFKGRFTDWLPYDRAEYESYKQKELLRVKNGTHDKETGEKLSYNERKHKDRLILVFNKLLEEGNYNRKHFSAWLNLSTPTINDVYLNEKITLYKIKEDNEKRNFGIERRTLPIVNI
jgi:hypothetical protein